MATDMFTRREVERAFRRFNECVDDLFASVWQTWQDNFNQLMTHCETNPVMRVVTGPLRDNSSVDGRAWHRDVVDDRDPYNKQTKPRRQIGAGHHPLPTDLDQQVAILYQFFLTIQRGEIDLYGFCIHMYNTTRHQDSFNTFSRELVFKFTREVTNRLNEILADIGGEQSVRREMLVAFHIHQEATSMIINGNVQGTNLAGPGATISNSTATYNSNGDLAEALQALKPLVDVVATEQRRAVEAALDSLVEATRKDIPVAQIVPDIDAAAKASPAIAERLKDIGLRLGTGLTSAGIVQAIKMYFGIH